MIIRSHDTDLLFITQVDHAALAARLVTAWRAGGLPDRPTRARVLEATCHHDLGWQEVDAAPTVDPGTGKPRDFITVGLDVKQGVWTRALDRLAPRDPYVAALVAHHAQFVYRRLESTPGWEAFFPAMERRRDELLATQPLDRDTFLQDYVFLRAGDLWSLVFCNDQQEPAQWEGYRAVLHRGAIPREQAGDRDGDDDGGGEGNVHGGWLEVTPDPFDGAIVPLAVSARRLPARRYASDADLRDALARAPIVQLTGVAAGAPPPPRPEPSVRG
jgi:hypothetical protein